MTVAPVMVHPAPVVALGTVALNSNCVPLNPAAITVCVPLIAVTSPAVQVLTALTVTPATVTNSPTPSELVAVTVTTVVDAVAPVGATAAGAAFTWTGKFPPAYAGV